MGVKFRRTQSNAFLFPVLTFLKFSCVIGFCEERGRGEERRVKKGRVEGG